MEVKTERFELRLETEILNRIDEWRSDQSDLPNRSEAVRRLLNLGLGSPENRQLFQIMRFQILIAAKTKGIGNGLSEGYVYAWESGVYPLFDDGADHHVPFADQFKISRASIEELSKYLDECWTSEKVPSFYELEDHYAVRSGRSSWDRWSLIVACRYMFLKELFDDAFWKALLKKMDHPSEARSITRKFDAQTDVYLN